MRRRKPWAISMRVECTFTSVILRLQAMDFTTLPHGTASETMRVPETSGRREFRISTFRLTDSEYGKRTGTPDREATARRGKEASRRGRRAARATPGHPAPIAGRGGADIYQT